jgi:hypothetical protein
VTHAANNPEPEGAMKTAVPTSLRTADSSDRTPTLAVRSAQPRPAAARVGAARRLLNALMRSLATPHI